MNTYILLLRGINVGGKNLMPMKALKGLLERNGFDNVKTYIQSGNVVFQCKKKPTNYFSELIGNEFGFTPKTLLLTKQNFLAAVANNPYAQYEGKFVHFYFCESSPRIDTNRLELNKSKTERYELIDKVFYLHAPDGIARSKLVATIEKCLGVTATGRNLNTIVKLKEMANAID